MGQDDSCGICGEHYQTCVHYRKLHISDTQFGTFCFRDNAAVTTENLKTYKENDVDPHDWCKACVREAKKRGHVMFYEK